jgi:hypothetical protein
MRIVITECDHDSFAPEHEVTDPIGAERRGHPAAVDGGWMAR